MDEYQYDELSMAMGFALFSVGLAPPVRPDSDQYCREDLRTFRPSMALRNFRFSGLPAAHSYDSHAGHEHFHSVEPEYSHHEHETHLERFQEENELGMDTENLSEVDEDEVPIIDGNVYPDDEIVKLDLFQRARTGTVIFDGFNANGQLMDDNFILTPRGVSVGASGSGNNSSNVSRKSVGFVDPTAQSTQPHTPLSALPPTPPLPQSASSPHSSAQSSETDAPVDPKAMLRNMLAGGIANRGAGKPNSTPPSTQQSTPPPVAVAPSPSLVSSSKQQLADADEPAVDPKAMLRNMLAGGIANRAAGKPNSIPPQSTPPANTKTPSPQPLAETDEPAVDPKAMLRNMLAGGIANRAAGKPPAGQQSTPPATTAPATTAVTTKSSNMPSPSPDQSAQQSSETDSPAVDPKAMLRNMLMGGIANRNKATEAPPTQDHIQLDLEDSSKARKNEASSTPPVSRATISTPNSNNNNGGTPSTKTPSNRTIASPNATISGSGSAPSSIKATPTNMTISSPYSINTTTTNAAEADTWSPRTRELPPLPPFSASSHSSGHSRRNLTPIVEGRESEDNTPAPTPFHMAGSL